MPTQSQAVAIAKDIIAFTAAVKSVRVLALDLQKRKGNVAPDSTWAALPTAAINTDGSLAAKDSTPVITNPIIDPSNVATPTYYLPSKTNLANAEALLDAFLQFLDGSAAPAQLNRNGTIDAILG